MEVPFGFCHCGCGKLSPIAKKTKSKLGHVKGQPVRYIRGHHMFRYPQTHSVEERGYKTPCWIWQGAINEDGYGTAGHGSKIHQIAFIEAYGPIPEGKELDHLCKQRACRNPEHLECVSHCVNIRRGALAKLDEEKVKEMRRLHALKTTYRELAEQFSVSVALVCKVVTRRAWIDIV